MVDPIEVKLDEVEDHVLKTQADVDRLMRDFSKPDKNKDILAQLPAGGGGFFDQLVKAITGGGKGGGALGAGVAGGMAAAGIMKLADILGDAVSNSKILTTVLGTIGQALGLLIDVILLPFLPILVTGIIWLYQGIMTFYKFWNGIWSGKTFQNLASGITALGATLAKGLLGTLTLAFGAITGTAGATWSVIQWLWGLATSNAAVNLALTLALGPVGILLNWLYTLVTGKQTPTVTLMMQVAGAAVSFLQWLWNTITSGGANLVVNLTQGAGNAVSSAVSGAGNSLSSIESAIGGAVSNPIGWARGAVNTVESAVSGMAQAVTNIFNFPNYVGSKADITKAVNDANRQQQYRYQA